MVGQRTIHGELPLHSVCPYFLPRELVGVVVDVVQVVLATRVRQSAQSTLVPATYLESTVCHDCPGKLRIEVLLVSHTSAELLLSKHLPESDVVVIRIDSNHLASLGISLFDL